MKKPIVLFDSLGIGVDIENIGRFRKLDPIKDKSFLLKIFTHDELKYCYSKKSSAPHLAVRFAAKEAIIKAMSSLNWKTPAFKQIEVINNKLGVPMVKFQQKKLKKIKVKLSLSHCQNNALAFAIIIDSL